MLCLIDADLVAFRAAASAENDGAGIACYRVDDTMHVMLDYIQPDNHECYLTGGNNFRKQITDTYKANRKDTPKPQYLQACRDHMVRKWGAKVINDMEADDALGIAQCTNPGQTILASLDKDLLMIPGSHYNWVKGTVTVMTEAEANRHLYWQMLVGDVSDNIIGVRGIGPKKADKILLEGQSVPDMFDIVRDIYKDDHRFLTNLNLFWILQAEKQLWNHKHMDLLIQHKLVQLAEVVEQKCCMYDPTLYLGNGTTVFVGTSQNGIPMAPMDSDLLQHGLSDEADMVPTSTD